MIPNLTQSLNLSPQFVGGGGGGGVPPPATAGAGVAQPAKNNKMAEQLVLELINPDLREQALLDLSKEIISIYPVLSPPTLTPAASNRVCNALALLQGPSVDRP
ncbi:hypothetical protein QJS04_geneDACA017733 [Acorus gramineus]|uniref:Uncharacterized protein n=1 Tax=Acorus gramineus TaxID=55184 RepID=A0AAV9BWH6_ACOGR|nr:hypothetical protein QJS04_geneDACA017733 [Acorus gramineus]